MSIHISVRAIICDNDELFLCSNSGNHLPCWCLPGGGLEKGETILDGIKRELLEEFGVIAEIGELLYIRELLNLDEDLNQIEFYFMVNNPKIFRSIDMSKAITAHEIEDYTFITIDKLNEYIVKPDILFKLMLELKNNNYIQSTKYIGNVK
jgi:ADP-ribose pyrophosphatase YjhB (NUDIX family)